LVSCSSATSSRISRRRWASATRPAQRSSLTCPRISIALADVGFLSSIAALPFFRAQQIMDGSSCLQVPALLNLEL
jgi:hypothetical protein